MVFLWFSYGFPMFDAQNIAQRPVAAFRRHFSEGLGTSNIRAQPMLPAPKTWKWWEKWWKNGWKCHGKYMKILHCSCPDRIAGGLSAFHRLDLYGSVGSVRCASQQCVMEYHWVRFPEMLSSTVPLPLWQRLQLRGTNDVETIFQFGRLKHLLLWHLWESPVAPGATENPKMLEKMMSLPFNGNMWRSKRATRTRYGKIWPLLIFND